MSFDVEQARFNMVEQQIRPWDVLDQDVLDLLFKVRREDFVPAAYRSLAFADLEIPIGEGQVMWPPKLEARVLQEIGIEPADRVLEIGTGSGYFTSLLSRVAGHVVSVEIMPSLAARARTLLERHGCRSIELAVGDGARGWGTETYDAIVLTGSTPLLPSRFVAQLRPGGRLFAVIGDLPVMTGRLVVSDGAGGYRSRDLFETVIAPLVNAERLTAFEF